MVAQLNCTVTQLVSYKRDILRPGEGSAGTRDKQAKKRDVLAKTGRLATLIPESTVLGSDRRSDCKTLKN